MLALRKDNNVEEMAFDHVDEEIKFLHHIPI
jgi:hypothetical protein